MQVDSDNFQEVKQQIIENIDSEKCKFIAMDLEMTGISHDEIEYKDDLPFERYNKMRKVPSKYNIIQVGLSLFLEDGNGGYVAHPYNVYVFPKSNPIFNPNINLQLGSIEFNCKHNMDYNRWIYKGVSYIQQANYVKFEQNMLKEENKIEIEGECQDVLSKLGADEQQKVLMERDNIKKWYEDENQKQDYVITQLKYLQKKYFNLYQEEKFPLVISDSKKTQYYMHDVTFKKCTKEEKQAHIQKIKDEQFQKFKEMVGFTDIMNKIYTKKVPIITHNGLFDHLFMYNTFIGPLPYSYTELKQNISKNFPQIYDTKRISSILQQKFTTSLENIKSYIIENKEQFKQNIPVNLTENSKKYNFFDESNAQYFHEAGFDAYLTGWVFIQFLDVYKNQIDQFKNQFPLYQNNYIMDLQDEDFRANETLTFVLKDKNFKIKHNASTQEKKDQQSQNLKKLKAKFPPETFGYNVGIRYHLQGEYYFVELNQESIQQYKEQFVKQVISLKASGFVVQSYADYIMERKAIQDVLVNELQKNKN